MLKKKLFPLYNTAMERLIRASRFSKNEEAQFRLKVIEFSNKYGVIRRRKENEYKGIKLTSIAFGVSRATIRRCEGGV